MDFLLLTTPEQNAFSNPAVERDPKRIGRLLAQLPVLNVAESAATLLTMLPALNEERVATKERLRLLELYRAPVVSIFNSFDRASLRHIPLSQQRRQEITEAVGRLYLEMASGYKIIVREAHAGGLNPAKNPAVLLAMRRAMEFITYALMHSFRMYGTPPPFAYLELNQLYLYAEHCGVADQAVAAERKAADGVSLQQLYVRIMMLAVADPYRLADGEADRLFGLLKRCGDACTVSQAPAAGRDAEGCFAVDLGGDRPPQKLASSKFAPDAQPRFIDASSALAAMGQEIRRREPAAQTAEDSDQRLLDKVTPNLQAATSRRHERHAVRREADAALGLEAVHAVLSGLRQAAAPGMESWLILNESASGYLLARQGVPLDEARVGEVVAIAAARGGEWREPPLVAVIRWLRGDGAARTEMGVETVAAEAVPVTCSPGAGGDDFPPQSGLFLPAIRALEIPASLLVAKRVYSKGRVITVVTGQKRVDVQAAHLLAETAYFDRFAFVTA